MNVNRFRCTAKEDAPLPMNVAELEKLIAATEAERVQCLAYIKETSAAENPAQGISYATELHEARQYKLMLDFQLEACRAKANRIRLGME